MTMTPEARICQKQQDCFNGKTRYASETNFGFGEICLGCAVEAINEAVAEERVRGDERVAAERERCAQVAEAAAWGGVGEVYLADKRIIAAAIRRGGEEGR